MSPAPPNDESPSAVAARLISGGRRPLVLGVVVVRSGDQLAEAMFDALAHVSEGADGIDLSLPTEMGPVDRLGCADQLAETTGADLYLRSAAPMAASRHTLILLETTGRVGASANVIHDLGLDQMGVGAETARVTGAWPAANDERSTLVSTVGFTDLSDAGLMGIASAASVRGVTAVSTNRVRIVRRVVDTLAPLTPRPPSRGMAPCR